MRRDDDDDRPRRKKDNTLLIVILSVAGAVVLACGGMGAIFVAGFAQGWREAGEQRAAPAAADEAVPASETTAGANRRARSERPIVVPEKRPLWQEYAANPATADQKYKGKLVEFDAYAKVSQEGGPSLLTTRVRPIDDPHLVIHPKSDQADRLAKLPGEQRVKVRGVVRGMERGADGRAVIVDDAEILGFYTFEGADKTYTPLGD